MLRFVPVVAVIKKKARACRYREPTGDGHINFASVSKTDSNTCYENNTLPN